VEAVNQRKGFEKRDTERSTFLIAAASPLTPAAPLFSPALGCALVTIFPPASPSLGVVVPVSSGPGPGCMGLDGQCFSIVKR
jgi:hypothetical protein